MKITKDLVAICILTFLLAVMSVITIQNFRIADGNRENLELVKRCVLPEGDLCKGNPDEQSKLIDELVRRIAEELKKEG